MAAVFLLLLLTFSGSLCLGNQTYLGTGASLAVCQPDSCAVISELAAMREKLAALSQMQTALEDSLKSMVKELATTAAKLEASDSHTIELQKLNDAQNEQLKTLKQNNAATQPKMAFSAALGSSVGPFEQDTVIKYQRILSNFGSGYNPATGTFTAMTRGMYYFRYTMYNNNSGQPNSVVSLMMNTQRVVSTWDTDGNNSHDSATNAAVVQLEAGDSVFMKLYANRVVYDDGYYYNTFSGFLLFAL